MEEGLLTVSTASGDAVEEELLTVSSEAVAEGLLTVSTASSEAVERSST